jgi:hypothetical protein
VLAAAASLDFHISKPLHPLRIVILLSELSSRAKRGICILVLTLTLFRINFPKIVILCGVERPLARAFYLRLRNAFSEGSAMLSRRSNSVVTGTQNSF